MPGKLYFNSLDGFQLAGILSIPEDHPVSVAVMVHGITADKDEGGFYTDIASALDNNNIASFRFDLRAHGESDGRQEDLTLLGGVSDIAAAVAYAKEHTGFERVHIIAASFGGGLCAIYSPRHNHDLLSVVLLNPNLDYNFNWLTHEGYWDNDRLTQEGAAALKRQGWLPHGQFHYSRAMLNEMIHIRPSQYMRDITQPVLTVHGTADSMVSFDIAKANYHCNDECKFIAVEGADHGFIAPGDESFIQPRTAAYRRDVTAWTVQWIREHSAQE